MASDTRSHMDVELKQTVLPFLRAEGFKGTLPHFRRTRDGWIDLMTFQFDKHGGGFVIEIARCPPDGIVTYWGKHIAPNKVRAWDQHPDRRKRLKPKPGGGTDSWFRFDKIGPAEVARQVLSELRRDDLWFGVIAT